MYFVTLSTQILTCHGGWRVYLNWLYLESLKNHLLACTPVNENLRTYTFCKSLITTEFIFIFIIIQNVNVLVILKQEAGFKA